VLRAGDVILAVEIHSPGTRRTHPVIKYHEYADAGIDHYWMVELDGRPTLAAGHRAGEFGYVDADPVQGAFTTDFPFPSGSIWTGCVSRLRTNPRRPPARTATPVDNSRAA
jgi:hypothetical protein